MAVHFPHSRIFFLHCSVACWHLVQNRHPSGISSRPGTVPSMVYKCSSCPLPSFGMEFRRPMVYGCFGWSKISSAVPYSTDFPAYMTITWSATSATTPISWVIRITEVLDSFVRVLMIRRIWAWIVTSRAVVGSSAISSLGLQSSAMAIITRCRIPPES